MALQPAEDLNEDGDENSELIICTEDPQFPLLSKVIKVQHLSIYQPAEYFIDHSTKANNY
jgi:hypothetical protein